MKKKNNKKYYPRREAELSLQFYRDKEGTPNFLITCNPLKEGKDFCTGVDRIIFAKNIIESGMLSINELVFLCDFFDSVRRELATKVNYEKKL